MPLLILHDIGWPLARRDAYYAPERIPAEHRQPLAHNTFLLPDEPGTADEGMPFACVAAREGGPRNGILTAVEDFLDRPRRARLRQGPGVLRLRRHLAPRRAVGRRGRGRGRAVGSQPGARAPRGQPGPAHGRALPDDPPARARGRLGRGCREVLRALEPARGRSASPSRSRACTAEAARRSRASRCGGRSATTASRRRDCASRR